MKRLVTAPSTPRVVMLSAMLWVGSLGSVALAQPGGSPLEPRNRTESRGTMESGRVVGPGVTFDPQVDTSIFSEDGIPDPLVPNVDLPSRVFSPSARDQPRPFDTVPGYRGFDDVLGPDYGAPAIDPSTGGVVPRGTDPGARSRVFDTRRGAAPPYLETPQQQITTPPGIHPAPAPEVPSPLPPGLQPGEPPEVGPQGADLPGVIPYPYSSESTAPPTTPGAILYTPPQITTPRPQPYTPQPPPSPPTPMSR